MKQYLETHVQIALALLTLAIATFVGAYVADRNQATVEEAVRMKLNEQRTYMLTLAEITDANGADATIAEILKECERTAEFESLLGQLATLGKKDLLTLQTLFDGCGSFQAERKALMVLKLEREFVVYQDLLALLSVLAEGQVAEYDEAPWQEIVAGEKLRSDLLRDLTDIQGDIISELVSGANVQSPAVSALVAEAQNVNQLLLVYGRKVSELRENVKD